MKARKLWVAVTMTAAAALVLAGCNSQSDAGSGSTASGGKNNNASIKLCMYTHGDGGAFWSVAKNGAEKAASDLGVTLDYQESNNDAQAQAQLIEAGVSGGGQGTVAAPPHPHAPQGAP